MRDLFAVRTETQRRIVVGALLVYVALFVAELSTGNRLAAAGADLLIGTLVLVASGVVAQRIRDARDQSPIALATVAALVVAGLAIAYGGLTTLAVVPAVPAIEFAGSIALLAAIGLYFYDQYT